MILPQLSSGSLGGLFFIERNIMEAVIVGIISSLIATLVFFGLASVFRSIVIPWFLDKIYRGVRIDGRWVNEQADEKKSINPPEFRLTIQQRADALSVHFP